jgi:hypothetical protein
MAKKFNLSKGLAGRLTGGLIGGAASAAWDKYVVPMFGTTIAGYENYLKVAVGAALPAIVKGNDMLTSVGDSLIAIGANNIVTGLLEDTPAPAAAGVPMVNAGRFPSYRRFVAGTETAEEKTPMVNSGVR